MGFVVVAVVVVAVVVMFLVPSVFVLICYWLFASVVALLHH